MLEDQRVVVVEVQRVVVSEGPWGVVSVRRGDINNIVREDYRLPYQSILYDIEEGVGLITLNRPDRLNAWNGEIEEELRDAIRLAAVDNEVKAIVVTGAGRGFCAGADMSDLSDSSGEESDSKRESERKRLQQDPMEGQLQLPSDYSMRYTYFTSIPKPVIAAINGPCACLLYTSPSPRDLSTSRMPSSA